MAHMPHIVLNISAVLFQGVGFANYYTRALGHTYVIYCTKPGLFQPNGSLAGALHAHHNFA